jgi:hypothetical protein
LAYQHDIFVSYKRDPESLLWIRRFLKPLLVHRVQMELGRPVSVYVHEVTDQIPAGTAWPVELGEVIATSRVLLAVWSGDYLGSEWCRQELSLMLHREGQCKARTAANKFGLVIPVVVHDGEKIPAKLAAAQQLVVKPYFNSRMPADGEKAEKLADEIAQHAPGIAGAIRAAPRWQKGWPRAASAQLLRAFNAQQQSQRTLPRFSRP